MISVRGALSKQNLQANFSRTNSDQFSSVPQTIDMSFTLAHITDIHMGPMPSFWNLKRMFGVMNWARGRCRDHRPEIFNQLADDMLAQRPNHIALSGDLVNIGLPAEYERALDWLPRLGTTRQLSIVPGNHDIYSALHGDPGVRRWQGYMRDNEEGSSLRRDMISGGTILDRAPKLDDADFDAADVAADITDSFPYLRRFGDIVLIGVNSALPTKPFIAAGHVGPGQRMRLAKILAALGASDLIRIVMIHHPPLPDQAPKRRALRDAPELAQILSAHGAELVLHGHNHLNMYTALPPRNGVQKTETPIVGTPSASMARRHGDEPLARYNLFHFARSNDGLQIEMVGRGFDTVGGDIVELERRRLMSTP